MAGCSSLQMALDLFELTRADWLANVRAWALSRATTGAELTTDDIHDYLPLPSQHDGRAYGAVFSGKEWECIGTVKSRRAVCHHRRIGVFRLKSAAQSVSPAYHPQEARI